MAAKVKMPPGYRVRWGGEYEDYTASRDQLRIVLPITLVLIFLILFALYNNFKFPWITVAGVVLSGPDRRDLRALAHRHPLLRVVGDRLPRALRRLGADRGRLHLVRERAAAGGDGHRRARCARAAMLRLRPIMMTALVAALGLLPAALSTGVGSDSQRPFALVIVGRTVLAAADQRVPHAGAVPGGRAPGGPSRGVSHASPARAAPRPLAPPVDGPPAPGMRCARGRPARVGAKWSAEAP